MAIGTPVSLGTTVDTADGGTHSTSVVTPSEALIIVVIGWASDTTARTLTTDLGAGLTWSADVVVTGTEGSAQYGMTMLSAQAPSGLASGSTLTVAFSGSTFGFNLNACYVTGLAQSSAQDGDSEANQFRTSPTTSWSSTAAPATDQADDIIIGAAFADGGGAGMGSTAGGTFAEVNESENTTNDWHQTLVYDIVNATGSYTATGTWSNTPGFADLAGVIAYKGGGVPQLIRPDADTTTTGWTTTPLFSKINDESDSTVIQATLS